MIVCHLQNNAAGEIDVQYGTDATSCLYYTLVAAGGGNGFAWIQSRPRDQYLRKCCL